MDSGIPTKVGRYLVDRLLGAGAMGCVYLARDPELDRAVAIKTVRDPGMGREALEAYLVRFKNEARAAARLHHPSIVSVFDVGEDESAGPYLVFEYVAGSTLKQILQARGALEPGALLRISDQIASALDAAHATGIVHRDVKPDNILVTADGRAKLADFGVARIPNAQLTREGQFLGTPCYAAPETLTAGKYGPESDLFSFAAVLYELASGTRAFPGDDAVAVAHKVVNDTPPPPSSVAGEQTVPRTVDAVIARAIAKKPDDRYPSAGAFVLALRDAYAREGLAPPVEERIASERPAPLAKRGRSGSTYAFAALLGGGLLVGVALVLMFGIGGGSGDDAIDAGMDLGGDAGSMAQQMAQRPVRDASPVDAGELLLTTQTDAGGAIDSGPSGGFDAEERAKDLLSRARALIAGGNSEGARQLIEEARRYDPTNPDIASLLARLRDAGP